MSDYNPCITCGACCAYFRVSFYWAEADPVSGGTVSPALTEKLNDFCVVMRGTDQKRPRCIALEGAVGKCVSCSIYDERPSVCREFEFSWQSGKPHEHCDKARIAWGLAPLLQFEVESRRRKV